MCSNAFRVAFLAIIMAVAPASIGYGQCTNGPVIAQPIGSGGTNQFTVQFPSSIANLGGVNHWMLVNDFSEDFGVGPLRTGYANPSAGTTKNELFAVGNPLQDGAGMQFTSCTIRAHLLSDSLLGNTTTVHLVVKQGTTVDVGPQYVIGSSTLIEVARGPMLLNPITSQKWTSADLTAGATIIGVRSLPNPTYTGVGLESIMLECE